MLLREVNAYVVETFSVIKQRSNMDYTGKCYKSIRCLVDILITMHENIFKCCAILVVYIGRGRFLKKELYGNAKLERRRR